MNPWRKRFFETTRGRLVALLRRRELTVDEMASALGVTDNAVRAQLTTLERDGLVEQRGVRRGVGKPSFAYGLTAEFEPTLSRAYTPMLGRLLRELHRRMTPAELESLLGDVGRQWAEELAPATGTPRERAAQAVALLEHLGGSAELEPDGPRWTIRGFGCPLGLAVRDEPRVCRAVEALLSRVTGLSVREQCDRGASGTSCRFTVGGPAGQASTV
jgi:predicted ArsR family transcriptional regulator